LNLFQRRLQLVALEAAVDRVVSAALDARGRGLCTVSAAGMHETARTVPR
jgi:hypothetical protein